MVVTDLALPGLKLIQPKVHVDSRGFFLETYQEQRYQEAGISVRFVQDNHSRSCKGTLRGLHYQSDPGQAKLVRVSCGKIFDVAVDIRPDSRTLGRWEGVYLDAAAHAQLFVPVGFAHGFCVVSDYAEVQYKVSSPYDPKTERSLRYDDPLLRIKWPVGEPLVSERDRAAEGFSVYKGRLGL